jgi:hypothetical protein
VRLDGVWGGRGVGLPSPTTHARTPPQGLLPAQLCVHHKIHNAGEHMYAPLVHLLTSTARAYPNHPPHPTPPRVLRMMLDAAKLDAATKEREKVRVWRAQCKTLHVLSQLTRTPALPAVPQ